MKRLPSRAQGTLSWVVAPQTLQATRGSEQCTALGQLNFRLILDHVDDILSVDDPAIIHATRLVWTRMKLVIEPSAAVGLAVVLQHARRFAGKRVAIVFSGGNVDIDQLPW